MVLGTINTDKKHHKKSQAGKWFVPSTYFNNTLGVQIVPNYKKCRNRPRTSVPGAINPSARVHNAPHESLNDSPQIGWCVVEVFHALQEPVEG